MSGTATPRRSVDEWRSRLGDQCCEADPLHLSFAARILANPAASSDVLLILADALHEAAEHLVTHGRIEAAVGTERLADLVASHAPERAA